MSTRNSKNAGSFLNLLIRHSDNSYQVTTPIRRQLLSGNNFYQATTQIKSKRRQLVLGGESHQLGINDNSYQVRRYILTLQRLHKGYK